MVTQLKTLSSLSPIVRPDPEHTHTLTHRQHEIFSLILKTESRVDFYECDVCPSLNLSISLILGLGKW